MPEETKAESLEDLAKVAFKVHNAYLMSGNDIVMANAKAMGATPEQLQVLHDSVVGAEWDDIPDDEKEAWASIVEAVVNAYEEGKNA